LGKADAAGDEQEKGEEQGEGLHDSKKDER
jgi:hypothetical protein